MALDAETIAYDLDGNPGVDFTRVLDRSRDNLQRDTGWQLKNGSTVENEATYTYGTTDGRLLTVAGASGSFQYSYLPNSNLLSAVTGPTHTVTNTWEATRNVLASKENKVGSTVISGYTYNVNHLGQRTGVSTAGTAFAASGSIDWGYNSQGEVVKADSSVNAADRAYQYDGIGNRLKSADSLTLPASNNYAPNVLNQYTSVNTLNPGYDFDGNMTSGPLPANPGANSTLVWDAENRLVSTTVNSVTTTYLYDSQSRRVAQMTGTATTVYVYDGWNPIAEYTSTTISKAFTWGMDLSGSMQGAGGVGGMLAVTDSTGSYYPTYDGNGNVSEYLDSTGAIAGHYEYDPFGRETVSNGTNPTGFSHRFSTKPVDATTGLLYYGYRYYDPATGRWPSRDPIEERGGVNLYGFVRNDGMKKIDVLGLSDSNWEWFSIISKSYINGVGELGQLPSDMPYLPLERLLAFASGNPLIQALIAEIASRIVQDANTRLAIMALVSETLNRDAFNQDPQTNEKDGQYRLYSKIYMQVCCENRKPLRRNDGWDKDGGREGPGIYGTMWLRYRFIDNGDNFQVAWTGWGRPNALAEPAFQWVGYRNDRITGLSIWHEGTAKISCDNNNRPKYVLESFLGSRYPSRKVWFNEDLMHTQRQRYFSDLWVEHPTRKGYVK